jgi:2-phosphoglycerate kinase
VSAILGGSVLWLYQPYVTFCIIKGFMREIDYVEEVRPTIKSAIMRSIRNGMNVVSKTSHEEDKKLSD